MAYFVFITPTRTPGGLYPMRDQNLCGLLYVVLSEE
jgi:hypothetical protein